jgi:HEAT repeat protein
VAAIAPDVPLQRPGAGDGSAFVVSRAAEAQRLVAFITAKRARPDRIRLIVLSGPAASGKTVLVTRWLIPALHAAAETAGRGVFYAKCVRLLPDVLSGEGGDARFDELLSRNNIVIVDEFDRVFNLPRDERRQQLDSLFDKLGRANPDAILLAVVSEQHLTSMYALSSYDPDIVNAVCEIKPVGLADGLEQLSAEDTANSITYSDEVLQRLRAESQELERTGIDVTFDLLRLLRDRFAGEARETGVSRIDTPQYEKIGGLLGVVREHVNRELDKLETWRPRSEAIARAILERVLDAQSRGGAADFGEIASRFEVSNDVVRSIVAQLSLPGGLLAGTASGQYRFQPPQVAPIIEEDAALQQLQNERTMRIVEEGLRSRQQLGTFLPTARFAEVHRQRHHLVVDDEMVRFLVQCALRDDTPGTATAQYWLGRVKSRDDAMDILLTAAFDPAPEVRERVASLLGGYAEPLVRDRLSVLALSDTAPAVRTAAIASLGRMADDELLQHLLQEVHKPNGQYRAQAIEALRVFPRAEVATVLQAIVRDTHTDLAFRVEAVNVLAALNIGDSVDALVDIALNDSDSDDREAAAKALGGAATEELNRRILSRLEWKRPTVRIVVASVLLAFGLTVAAYLAGLPIVGLILMARTDLVVGLVALAIATGVLLRRLRDDRITWRSPIGFLTLGLFALSAVTVMPVLHGLAHVMVRRWRRAFALFGIELAGVFMYGVLAGATEFVPGLGIVAKFYRATGIVLFVASYLYDVLAVGFRTFLFRRALMREERRSAIYRETFRNPAMSDAVFDDLRGASVDDAKRAKRLIRGFGGSMLPTKLLAMLTAADASYRPYVVWALRDAKDDEAIATLERLAPTARPTQQFAIAAVLSGNPTARSIAALHRVAAKTGLLLRVLATAATLKFRLSVWPWSARLAVLFLVPAFGVVLYHGTMIIRNPAWSEIVSLRRPLPSDIQKAKIVNFLVDAYPRESASQLRELFAERRHRPIDSFHAALVRGLVTIQDQAAQDPTLPDSARVDVPLRNQLAAEIPRFDSLMRQPDSAEAAMSVEVLRAMARSSDSALMTRGVETLVRFVNEDAGLTENTLWKYRSALRAIGASSYARALPTLDSLLKSRIADKPQSQSHAAGLFSDMIRDQILRTARQANATVGTRTGADRGKLLATLNALETTAPELTALKDELKEAAKELAGCDSTTSGICSGKEEAFKAIEENPASEDGYRDLYSHYAAVAQYRQATDTFQLLKGRYKNSIWPRKILSEIDHEGRSLKDTAAFERAYTEMIALRKLDSYDSLKSKAPEDYVRVESDFVEIALGARRFAEAESAARRLMADTARPVDRLNMSLFIYMAAVLQHDAASANARLTELESIIRALPPNHYNNWVYPGTLVLIDRSDLAPPLRRALRDLCKEGQWYTQQRATDVISENRSALATLEAKGT